MPDANGNFKGISVPSAAWERVFGPARCHECGDVLTPLTDCGGDCRSCVLACESFLRANRDKLPRTR